MTEKTIDWRAQAASQDRSALGPQRIVCLTEEPTEWLYLLGEERRIVGISGYTVRPPQARVDKPKVSAFLSAKIDKIVELKPDCVIGFSDLQADIAAQLIRAGVQVTIFNQRSVAEIFSMMFQLAAMVGQTDKGLALINVMQQRLTDIAQVAATLPRRPRVYFEEWYDPHISAIAWVSELVGIAGGDDCFPELAREPMGKGRIIADGADIVARQPDIIIGSWCGRRFRPAHVLARPGWGEVNAVKTGQIFEIKSADILQPGPAALTDGVEQLHRIVMAWGAEHGAN
jgi:iron complex transport system substrate-binding protein